MNCPDPETGPHAWPLALPTFSRGRETAAGRECWSPCNPTAGQGAWHVVGVPHLSPE